jgi:hypothetical protein
VRFPYCDTSFVRPKLTLLTSDTYPLTMQLDTLDLHCRKPAGPASVLHHATAANRRTFLCRSVSVRAEAARVPPARQNQVRKHRSAGSCEKRTPTATPRSQDTGPSHLGETCV